MPFQKDHPWRAKKILDQPLDKTPICFKGYEGQKDKLKSVPNWQERIRQFVDELISEQNA
ncbi:hypothetical protein MC7420_8270 [Coleofasciculus chthonoplastes PCC 7420]|jgi:hypothetical protein|uniref:Uncharacterized protein n=1 Tax=Coleofasciculus chthonoplastes PCC 7420 TaxID=118168 RepID=B4W0T0_9CYAN|nr:hypothetical protein MC7420_8270 [Coleofasciculus chthonoplastes PCC 7420]